MTLRSVFVTLSVTAALAQTTQPGSTASPELVLLPAGQFVMGDHYAFVKPQRVIDEVPMHTVSLSAFYAGKYHVTNTQYLQYLTSALSQGLIEVRNNLVYAKGTSTLYLDTYQVLQYNSIGWDGSAFSIIDTRALHPAAVTWYGAIAYCNWLSQQQGLNPVYDLTTGNSDLTQNGYRLPTEAEWEYAARGGQYNPYYIYPWGNDADVTKANWPESNSPYASGPQPWTTPVGFYNGQLHNKSDYGWPGSQTTYQTGDGSNGFGLFDMCGNNWQWTNDWYDTAYYGVSPGSNPPGPTQSQASVQPDGQVYRIIKGGTWYNSDPGDPGHGRASNRNPAYHRAPDNPGSPYYHIGFRVVRNATGQ